MLGNRAASAHADTHSELRVFAPVSGNHVECDCPSAGFECVASWQYTRSSHGCACAPTPACPRAAAASYVLRYGLRIELDADGRAWRRASDVAATCAAVESSVDDGAGPRRLVRPDCASWSEPEQSARAVESDAVLVTECCYPYPDSQVSGATSNPVTDRWVDSHTTWSESDRAIWPISTSNIGDTVAKQSTRFGCEGSPT